MRIIHLPKAANACARAMIAALALFALLLASGAARAETDGTLRVKLSRLGSPSEVQMQADCDYTVAANPSFTVPAGTDMRVRASGGSLTFSANGRTVDLGAQARLTRGAGGNRGLSFLSPALSNRFCGDLTFAASGDAITAVLDIYIEDYLYGVVGYEMSPSSDLEALKAQAVAARSRALERKAARSGSAYDLTDSGDGLSFRGYSASEEYADAVRAVDETRGLALTYGSGPVACYFCDSNGGQIESSENALGVELPYSEVRDDPYDFDGAGVRKTARLRRDASGLSPELLDALRAGMAEQLTAQGIGSDATVVSIEDIDLEAPRFEAPSRLYTVLALRLAVTGQTARGEAQTVEVTVRVPTYGGLEDWYDLSINDEDNETVWLAQRDREFEITFRRSGSGVGMSKRGAQVMALQGLSCEAILEYYYPGCALTRMELTDAARPTEAEGVPEPIATARLSQKSRLYEKADAASGALTTLPAGATVDVYAVQGEWAAVGSGALYGFTHAEALASFHLVGVAVAQVKNETLARINADSVDVLQLPVATATALERLSAGSTVRLNAYTDAWALVTTASGTEGFIPREALTLQGAARAGDEGDTVTAPDSLYGLLTEDAGLYVNADDSIEPRQILSKGGYVRILAYNSVWAYVRLEDGQSGYVQLSALSAVQRAGEEAREEIDGGPATKVEGEQYRYIAAEALSLFKSYSTDSEVLATLRRGDRVRLIAYNAKWAAVRVDGAAGFVLLSGLTETDPDAARGEIEGGEIIRVKGTQYVVVATDGAPLYPTWDASEAPVALLSAGTQVQLGAYNGIWACVRVDGVTGFMRVETLKRGG